MTKTLHIWIANNNTIWPRISRKFQFRVQVKPQTNQKIIAVTIIALTRIYQKSSKLVNLNINRICFRSWHRKWKHKFKFAFKYNVLPAIVATNTNHYASSIWIEIIKSWCNRNFQAFFQSIHINLHRGLLHIQPSI